MSDGDQNGNTKNLSAKSQNSSSNNEKTAKTAKSQRKLKRRLQREARRQEFLNQTLLHEEQPQQAAENTTQSRFKILPDGHDSNIESRLLRAREMRTAEENTENVMRADALAFIEATKQRILENKAKIQGAQLRGENLTRTYMSNLKKESQKDREKKKQEEKEVAEEVARARIKWLAHQSRMERQKIERDTAQEAKLLQLKADKKRALNKSVTDRRSSRILGTKASKVRENNPSELQTAPQSVKTRVWKPAGGRGKSLLLSGSAAISSDHVRHIPNTVLATKIGQ